MPHTISAVSGRARKAGVRPGDELLSINGEPVLDNIDYQSLTAEESLRIEVRRNGEKKTFLLNKPEYDDPGLEFCEPLLGSARLCCNNCLFCFVEQLPACARESLRVRDDDWRMSLMMGNYVTLTNMPERGIRRIIRRHASPLYISVHAMDPALRERIMGTPRARDLPRQLRELSDGGISFHAQAVLCPGVNDGDALEDTISSLLQYRPHALSLALVPVGLTAHREGLAPLRKFTRSEAAMVLDIADRWREKLLREQGTRFVFPSDEFYLAAGRPLPRAEEYEDYGQLDDGVGMLRLFEKEFAEAYCDLPASLKSPAAPPRRYIMATGVSAAPFLDNLVSSHPLPRLSIEVRPVENRFFGPSVTVSGLLTGSDLLRELKGARAEGIFITETMLRQEDKVFLDDMPLSELEKQLGIPVIPVGRGGYDLIDAFTDAINGRRN